MKSQVSKANPKFHTELITKLREITPVNVKVSGNINNTKAVLSCSAAKYHAVNTIQINNIIRELQSKPISELELEEELEEEPELLGQDDQP